MTPHARAPGPMPPTRRRGTWWRLALCLALTACATARKDPPVAVQPVVQASGQGSLRVTDAQAGAAVLLDPGQELIVSLAVSVVAGSEWLLVDAAPGVLALQSSQFERTGRNFNAYAEESAGAVVWRFRPQAAGTAGLRFELRRSRSLQPASRVVTFGVTVK